MSNPLNIDCESIISECVSAETLTRADMLKNSDTCWRIQFPIFNHQRIEILECKIKDVLFSTSGIIVEFINIRNPLRLPDDHPLATRVSYRIDTFFLSKKEAQDAVVLFRLAGSINK